MPKTAAEYKGWLDSNPDKVGTPDYVKVSDAYAKSQDDPFSDVSGPAGVGMSPTMTDEASRTDPNTVGNIAVASASVRRPRFLISRSLVSMPVRARASSRRPSYPISARRH